MFVIHPGSESHCRHDGGRDAGAVRGDELLLSMVRPNHIGRCGHMARLDKDADMSISLRILMSAMMALSSMALVASEQTPAGQVVSQLISGSAQLPQLMSAPVAEAQRIGDELGDLGQRLFFTDERIPESGKLFVFDHTVASGQYPATILRKYGLHNKHLELLNPTYSDTNLRAGQVLKVFDRSQLDMQILVRRSAFRCWVLAKPKNDKQSKAIILASYPVGIGKADRATPLRSYARSPLLNSIPNGRIPIRKKSCQGIILTMFSVVIGLALPLVRMAPSRVLASMATLVQQLKIG